QRAPFADVWALRRILHQLPEIRFLPEPAQIGAPLQHLANAQRSQRQLRSREILAIGTKQNTRTKIRCDTRILPQRRRRPVGIDHRWPTRPGYEKGQEKRWRAAVWYRIGIRGRRLHRRPAGGIAGCFHRSTYYG